MAGVQGVTNEVGSRPGTEDKELGGTVLNRPVHGMEKMAEEAKVGDCKPGGELFTV